MSVNTFLREHAEAGATTVRAGKAGAAHFVDTADACRFVHLLIEEYPYQGYGTTYSIQQTDTFTRVSWNTWSAD